MSGSQTPGNYRRAIVLALAVLGIGAAIIFARPTFWPVAIANSVMAMVGDGRRRCGPTLPRRVLHRGVNGHTNRERPLSTHRPRRWLLSR
jgi:hypothetical protein